MKTIQYFCNKNNFTFKVITYKHKNFKSRGFDILDVNNKVIFTFERVRKEWLITNKKTAYVIYANKLTKNVLNNL